VSPTSGYRGRIVGRTPFAGVAWQALHYLGGLRRLGVPEAYGMVAIEAMACGTPVVALANGALPELVEPHLTGFVANDALGLPDLVTPTETLERRAVRQPALDRFSIAATGKRYVELYAEISPVLRRGHLRRRRTKTEHWPEERRWST
jgi:glycosyltransferase involved in cell wall biosynthesis